MMYRRLQLLRELLREDGVIFVSIDDNEVQHLRMLMDEVFGEANFVAAVPVKSNPRGRQSDTHVASVHDYCVSYAQHERSLELNGLPLSHEHLAEFDQEDPDGRRWRELGLRQQGSGSLREDRPDMFFQIFVNPTDGTISLTPDSRHRIEVVPRKSDRRESRWMSSLEKVEIEKHRAYGRLVKTRGEYDVFIK